MKKKIIIIGGIFLISGLYFYLSTPKKINTAVKAKTEEHINNELIETSSSKQVDQSKVKQKTDKNIKVKSTLDYLENYKKNLKEDLKNVSICKEQLEKTLSAKDITNYSLLFQELNTKCLYNIESIRFIKEMLQDEKLYDDKWLNEKQAEDPIVLFLDVYRQAFKRRLAVEEKKELLRLLNRRVKEYPPLETAPIQIWLTIINEFLDYCGIKNTNEGRDLADQLYAEASHESRRIDSVDYFLNNYELAEVYNSELLKYFQKYEKELDKCTSAE